MRAQLTRLLHMDANAPLVTISPGISFALAKHVMGKSVLIVDDNDHLRQILASILRFSGYQVAEAASGSEAIDKARLVKPSLIVLDLSLRGMSGIDVARAIKKKTGSPPKSQSLLAAPIRG